MLRGKWQIRCVTCGRTRDAVDANITRIGAASYRKYTLGWCTACRWLRIAAIERVPAPPTPPAPPPETTPPTRR